MLPLPERGGTSACRNVRAKRIADREIARKYVFCRYIRACTRYMRMYGGGCGCIHVSFTGLRVSYKRDERLRNSNGSMLPLLLFSFPLFSSHYGKLVCTIVNLVLACRVFYTAATRSSNVRRPRIDIDFIHASAEVKGRHAKGEPGGGACTRRNSTGFDESRVCSQQRGNCGKLFRGSIRSIAIHTYISFSL